MGVNRPIVSVKGRRLIVTPGREPIESSSIIVPAVDQDEVFAVVLLPPIPIVPFGVVGFEDAILRASPILTVGNAIAGLKLDVDDRVVPRFSGEIKGLGLELAVSPASAVGRPLAFRAEIAAVVLVRALIVGSQVGVISGVRGVASISGITSVAGIHSIGIDLYPSRVRVLDGLGIGHARALIDNRIPVGVFQGCAVGAAGSSGIGLRVDHLACLWIEDRVSVGIFGVEPLVFGVTGGSGGTGGTGSAVPPCRDGVCIPAGVVFMVRHVFAITRTEIAGSAGIPGSACVARITRVTRVSVILKIPFSDRGRQARGRRLIITSVMVDNRSIR